MNTTEPENIMNKRKTQGEPPKTKLPKGSIDTHMHVFDSSFQTNPAMAQPKDNAGLSMYSEMQQWLGLERTVVVQANAHEKDNSCLLNALEVFGKNARGVACITPDMNGTQLFSLHQQGIRAARIMELGGAVRMKDLLAVNELIHPLNWSCIVQFNGSEIANYLDTLKKIKGHYTIDHIGKFFSPTKTTSQSFKSLLELIDKGNCYIKIAACYETSQQGHPFYQDTAELAKALINHAPERIIWGSNWPHIMSEPHETPNDAELLDTIASWIPNSNTLQKIFVENPAALYGFDE